MAWKFRLYPFTLLVAASLAKAMAMLAWQRRATPGATPLALIMLAVAVWIGLTLLEHAVIGFQHKLLFGKIEYLGIASVPPLWLIFALSYCGLTRFLEQSSGLGLAFCKFVIEAHGQRIWVENSDGAGTTFALTLAVAV